MKENGIKMSLIKHTYQNIHVLLIVHKVAYPENCEFCKIHKNSCQHIIIKTSQTMLTVTKAEANIYILRKFSLLIFSTTK